MTDPATLAHFFFFGFFFFTPPLTAGAGLGIATLTLEVAGPDDAASSSLGCGDATRGTANRCSRRRFCIFSISERFSASKRLRNIDEYVLNLRHWPTFRSVRSYA